MLEEQFIDFKCPQCEDPVSFPDFLAGTAQACPGCRDTLLVPGASCDVGPLVPLPIPTARLTLRRIEAGDWKDLLEILGDEELCQYLDADPMDEDHVLRWIEEDQQARITQPGHALRLAMALREGHTVIGYTWISYLDDTHRQVRILAAVNRKFQRQGYATEAIRAMLGFGFNGLGLFRIAAQCDSRNVAGLRLLAKAGLRREGESLKSRLFRGEWTDVTSFALLAGEFRSA